MRLGARPGRSREEGSGEDLDWVHRSCEPIPNHRWRVPMAVAGWLVVGLAVAGFLAIGPTPSWAQVEGALSNEDCLGCHDRDRLAVELPSGEVLDGTVDAGTYDGSAHGTVALSCSGCHRSITEYPHPEQRGADAREYSVIANEVCARCHASEQVGDNDVHGLARAAGSPDAPVCSSCHGAHDVVVDPDPAERSAMCLTCHQPRDEVTGRHVAVSETGGTGLACSDCHGSHTVPEVDLVVPTSCARCHESAVEAYDESVHGLALAAGDEAAASCANCHGPAHGALASNDPSSSAYPLRLPETCGTCHGNAQFAEEHGLPNVFEQYVDSIHGRAVLDKQLLIAANCSTCHGSHGIRAPDDPASRVFPSNVPSTCGSCHGEIESLYRASVHGAAVAGGDLGAAICTDCHTAHEITGVDTVEWKLEVVRECGTCHEESLTTYRDTFHGQVTSLGYTRVARCSDCHEYHTIQHIDDPRSAVSSVRLLTTCQKCHPTANENFAQFSPHADSDNPDDGAVLHYTALFMSSLIVGVLGFFGIHTTLWSIRAGIERGTSFARRSRLGKESAGGDDTSNDSTTSEGEAEGP